MSKIIDPKEFWETKITKWEEDRYNGLRREQPLIEKVAGFFSRSLLFRLEIARKLLLPFVQGKRIVELGCGSGLLAEEFILADASEYLGIDIAESAIQAAQKRVAVSKYVSRIRFERFDITSEIKSFDADVIVSLGLFDWLTKEEIKVVFEKTKGLDFFHSISEQRPLSLQQTLHRLYVYFAYGHKTGPYVPKYYKAADIIGIARPFSLKDINIYRNRKLSFGVFLTTLPIKRIGPGS